MDIYICGLVYLSFLRFIGNQCQSTCTPVCYFTFYHLHSNAIFRCMKFNATMIWTFFFFQDYFSSHETGQSVGWAKTQEPRENSPGTPSSRTWRVSHVHHVSALDHFCMTHRGRKIILCFWVRDSVFVLIYRLDFYFLHVSFRLVKQCVDIAFLSVVCFKKRKLYQSINMTLHDFSFIFD